MFTRRKLIKAGLLSFPAVNYAGRADAASLSPDNGSGGQSPPTTPFIDPLPIPPPAQSLQALTPASGIGPVGGEAPRADHQFFNQFPPKVFYDIHERSG